MPDLSALQHKEKAVVGGGIGGFDGIHQNEVVLLCQIEKLHAFRFGCGNGRLTEDVLSALQRLTDLGGMAGGM